MNSLSREGIRYLGSLPADADIARASLLEAARTKRGIRKNARLDGAITG
jgi:hypothetical protein